MSKKVKMGDLVVVENTQAHPNACKEYLALWIEDASGAKITERCVMFRNSSKFTTIKFSDRLGIKMKPGRLYPFSIGEKQYLIVQVKTPDGSRSILRLTNKIIKAAEAIAAKNKEDIPDRGWFNDLID